MNQLKVHDWDTWQTYRKDRGRPPWIKVHRILGTSQKWSMLSDAERGQLVSLWLLASDTDGILPDNALLLRKMAGMSGTPNLRKFKELSLLDGGQDDAKVTPTRRHDDAKRSPTRRHLDATEVDTEKDADKEVEPPIIPHGNDSGFETFWKAYPYNSNGRKMGKAAALKAWKKLKPNQALTSRILAAIRKQSDTNHWAGSNGDVFVPHASTWLNKGNWDDEIGETSEDRQRRESHEETRRVAEKLGLAK